MISFLNDQAVATQKDLELNLELTSSLKKEKASLLSELKIMKKSLQESADEKTELTNVLATKSVQWGEVQNLVNTHVREKEELKKVLEAAKTESKNFKLQLKSAVEGALVTEATLKDLEDDLDTRREQSIILQEELLKQSVRSISSVLCCVVLCHVVLCCVVLCFLLSALSSSIIFSHLFPSISSPSPPPSHYSTLLFSSPLSHLSPYFLLLLLLSSLLPSSLFFSTFTYFSLPFLLSHLN